MYQFNEECNHSQYFWWSKKLIRNMNWAMLPKPSKAVFPVIASHANEKGEAFPGERRIAILAGISDKKAREGIKGLEAFPGFSFDYYLTKRGKRAKKFMVKLPLSNSKGKTFPFYKFVLEAGLWREMKPSAKALYPVMRYYGYFDIELYEELENLDIASDDFQVFYLDRKYDFCDADINVLAEYSGLHRNSIAAGLKDLERNFLIERMVDYPGWKVFLKSKDSTIWKREYLNKKIMASYRYKS